MRTSTLFGAAVFAGVIGGVGTGYAIQAARPATPLPPLAQTQPQYAPAAVYQGIAQTMLPSAQDDAALTDGDLTKLLLPMPSGATANPSGWLDQSINAEQEADLCTVGAVSCFTSHYNEGVVSIADTSWVQNGFNVEIRIYRFAGRQVGPGPQLGPGRRQRHLGLGTVRHQRDRVRVRRQVGRRR